MQNAKNSAPTCNTNIERGNICYFSRHIVVWWTICCFFFGCANDTLKINIECFATWNAMRLQIADNPLFIRIYILHTIIIFAGEHSGMRFFFLHVYVFQQWCTFFSLQKQNVLNAMTRARKHTCTLDASSGNSKFVTRAAPVNVLFYLASSSSLIDSSRCSDTMAQKKKTTNSMPFGWLQYGVKIQWSRLHYKNASFDYEKWIIEFSD